MNGSDGGDDDGCFALLSGVSERQSLEAFAKSACHPSNLLSSENSMQCTLLTISSYG